MERKLGEVFEHEGVKLEVVKENSCKGCYFDTGEFGLGCEADEAYSSNCARFNRSDKTSVIFCKIEVQ